MKGRLKVVLELGKVRISLLAALSAAAGYSLGVGRLSLEMALPAAGLFLLACGSCTLNHWQERHLDGLMHRTRARPIPSGRISSGGALFVALAFLAAGSLVLLLGANALALALGLTAAFWYNAIYTPLKRFTTLAAVPGAVIGGIPPAVGWVASGASLLDARILALSFFFFVWQVPHFWLLLLEYGAEYERAGLPSLSSLWSQRQLVRVIFVWMLASALACLLLPLFGSVRSGLVVLGLLAAALWLAWSASGLLRNGSKEASFRHAFRGINLYALLILALVFLDSFFGPAYLLASGP